MKNNVKIFCVLRKSNVYDVDYVLHLKKQADRYAPGVPFNCISNVPVPCDRINMVKMWPGWWSKMELFRPDIDGDIFFIDLDTIICDEIWDLLGVNQLTMLSDFYKLERPASGLMYLPKSFRNDVWKRFTQNSIGHMTKHKVGGDQAFLAECFGGRAVRWQDEFPNRVISYKAQRVQQNGMPEGAGILCFHGVPKPRDISWNVKGIDKVV